MEHTPKIVARNFAASLVRILNQREVDCFDLEAALGDAERLVKLLGEAAEKAYEDDTGNPKKGWRFE